MFYKMYLCKILFVFIVYINYSVNLFLNRFKDYWSMWIINTCSVYNTEYNNIFLKIIFVELPLQQYNQRLH